MVEHDDAIADPHHQAHVVLDEDERDAERRADDGSASPTRAALLRIHAGSGLVEKHQLRLARQRTRELDRLLDAVGQRCHFRIRVPGKLQYLEHLVGALVHRAPRGAIHAEELGGNARAMAKRGPHRDVLAHRRILEELEVLEGAANTHAGKLVDRLFQHILAAKRTLPRVGA